MMRFQPDTDKGFKNAFGGGEGVRGFISRSALEGLVSDAALRRADTGCRNPLGATDRGATERLSSASLDSELYQGRTTARRICLPANGLNYTSTACGAAFDSYQPPLFDGDLFVLAFTTTGVTGGEGRGRSGGTATAIVSAERTVRVLDRIGYNDPNVPCDQTPRVRWYYVNANPNGSTGIYGWVPQITANESPVTPTRTRGSPRCPLPASP